MEGIMKNTILVLAITLLYFSPAGMDHSWAQSSSKMKPGKIKVVGDYPKLQLREGKKKKTYSALKPKKEFKLRAAGPAAFILKVRGRGKANLTFKIDGGQAKNLNVTLLPKVAKGVYVRVPVDTHVITVSSTAKKTWIRPIKAKGEPKKSQQVIAWEAKAKPAEKAVAETKPVPASDTPELPPPPVAEPEPIKKAEMVAPIEPKPTPPSDSYLKKMEKKADEKPMLVDSKPTTVGTTVTDIQPLSSSVSTGQRPVEVRLRMLSDRLAAGFQALPGKGRYERIVVAKFSESGDEVKSQELGALVSAQLNTFLKKDHNFFMIERARLADALKEMEMAMTGLIDPSKAAEIGKMLGAQAMVVGSISQAGADFIINARLISVESAAVLVADSINVPRAGLISLAEESVVLRTKSGAIFRSLLVPGWGQFYNREPVKGGIVIGTELAMIGAAVAMHLLGQSDENKYTDSKFALNYPDLTPAELGEKATALRESAQDYYQARNIFIYAAAGVWLYNILDAYLFGVDGEKEAGLELAPMGSADVSGNYVPGIGFGLSY
jgi:TolB-like protein